MPLLLRRERSREQSDVGEVLEWLEGPERREVALLRAPARWSGEMAGDRPSAAVMNCNGRGPSDWVDEGWGTITLETASCYKIAKLIEAKNAR